MPDRNTSDSEGAHPLVAALLERRTGRDRVLVLGIGSGRNIPPLLDAGLRVDAVESRPDLGDAARRRFGAAIAAGTLRVGDDVGTADASPADALLATHGLLHGTVSEVRALLDRATAKLRPGGRLYATFGSQSDPRFGRGTRIDESSWAERSGSEAGVVHCYFTRRSLTAALESFDIDDLTETSARESAGSWAHSDDEKRSIVHWFVRGRRRATAADAAQ